MMQACRGCRAIFQSWQDEDGETQSARKLSATGRNDSL